MINSFVFCRPTQLSNPGYANVRNFVIVWLMASPYFPVIRNITTICRDMLLSAPCKAYKICWDIYDIFKYFFLCITLGYKVDTKWLTCTCHILQYLSEYSWYTESGKLQYMNINSCIQYYFLYIPLLYFLVLQTFTEIHLIVLHHFSLNFISI